MGAWLGSFTTPMAIQPYEFASVKFLGSGYSLFFKLSKYVGLILAIIFLVSGSGYYFLAGTFCKGEDSACGSFFGIPFIIHEIPK